MAILIAIRYHQAPDWVKSIIASGESIGRLLTPIGLYIGFRIAAPTARVSAIYMTLTALLLGISALAPSLFIYTISIILSYIFFAQSPHLMLHIYSQNYTAKDRGTRVSTMFVLSTAIGSLFSFLIGKSLDIHFEFYKYQFAIMALCGLACSWVLTKIPSTPLEPKEAGNPWANISLLWKDKLFGYLTIGYIILGLGNSMVIPIRIEYMVNNEYAINASNLEITLINVVIPGCLYDFQHPALGMDL